MFMTAIDLETVDFSQQHAFYTQILGLSLRQTTRDSFTVQAGTTALTFRASSQHHLLYHFAFTIPINKWKQAKAWLTARTTLLEGEGEDEFESKRVRTHSYYFSDPAGNILEFIAREDLPGKAGADFGAEDVLHISEIDLVVDDVPAVMKQLHFHRCMPSRGLPEWVRRISRWNKPIGMHRNIELSSGSDQRPPRVFSLICNALLSYSICHNGTVRIPNASWQRFSAGLRRMIDGCSCVIMWTI